MNAQSNYEFDGQVLGQTNIGFGKEGTKFRELQIIPHDYDYSIELVGGKDGGEILVGDELGLQIGISNCVVQPKADFFHLIVNGNRTDVDWNEIKREEDCVYYECNITVPIEEGRRNVAFEVGSSTLKQKPRLRSSAFKVSERVVFNIQQESTEKIHPLEGQNISLEIKNLADTPETRFVEIPGSTHRFDLKPQEVRMERGLNPDGVVEQQETAKNANISGGRDQDKTEETERTENRAGNEPSANTTGDRE